MRRFWYYGASSAGASLLLDLYPATAAYSLRKLRTAYLGSAIRVRRSSDNAEQDIGFSGNDLDTASLLSFVGANNGFVTTWYDQQGANNLTQSIIIRQPQIVSSGSTITRGGKGAVKFLNSRLLYNANIFNTGGLNTSHFSVSNNDASPNSIGTIISTGLDFRNIRLFNERSSINKRQMIINDASAVNYVVEMSTFRTDGNPLLHSNFIDSSYNMSGFDNGNVGTTNTFVGTAILAILQMGVQATGTATPLNGTIQEYIGFNTNESANRTAIETNINNYYGIY
jgi:hypothetical protein